MEVKFDKNKYISIIEINSTAIHFLSGLPKFIKRKPYDLNRFELFNSIHLPEKSILFKNNLINIKIFQHEVFPVLKNHIKRILFKNPQRLEIIIVGIYRNAENSKAFLDTFKNEINQNKNINVKLLSTNQESKLSYLSWENTYLTDPKNETELKLFKTIKTNERGIHHHKADDYFSNTDEKNYFKALHINVEGSTTEVTLIENNMSFENTLSIPIGVDGVIEEFLISDSYIDKQKLMLRISEIQNLLRFETTSFFKKEKRLLFFKKEIKLNYCVCSCGSSVFKREDEINYFTQYYVKELGIEVDYDKITLIIKECLRLQGRYGSFDIYGQNFEYSYIQLKISIIGILLKEIFKHFNIQSYFLNKSNLRIGAYYDVYHKIRPL